MKQNKPVFALIDANNFFVSCELLFRPDLIDKPVVVMSSNDGCVVSRSNEAKSIGVPMGAPVFKHKALFDRHKVVSFSANFELYGDISKRITDLLSSVTPNIEIYSVDESFLDISNLGIDDFEVWGLELRDMLQKFVGIPVSIGIAPTKTLAKLASERAKKDKNLRGVLYLNEEQEQTKKYLSQTKIQDIWGVGRRLSPKLLSEGIVTAFDLSEITLRRARQLMGVHGTQMVSELSGISCIDLEVSNSKNQSISSTRTFGEDTSDIYEIESAIATFVSIASFRLRRSGQLTRKAGFFITTNRNKPNYQSFSSEVGFSTPTADPGIITSSLVDTIQKIYKDGIKYHRAGVLLYDFVSVDNFQTDILGFVDTTQHNKSRERMKAVDYLGSKFGKNTVHFASEDLAKNWKPRRNLSSPHYTTSWEDLPIAKIV